MRFDPRAQYLDDLNKYRIKLDGMKLGAPDSHTQRKYDQTSEFIGSIFHEWINIVNRSEWITYLHSVGDINHFNLRALNDPSK
jgi:hypothetical protein